MNELGMNGAIKKIFITTLLLFCVTLFSSENVSTHKKNAINKDAPEKAKVLLMSSAIEKVLSSNNSHKFSKDTLIKETILTYFSVQRLNVELQMGFADQAKLKQVIKFGEELAKNKKALDDVNAVIEEKKTLLNIDRNKLLELMGATGDESLANFEVEPVHKIGNISSFDYFTSLAKKQNTSKRNFNEIKQNYEKLISALQKQKSDGDEIKPSLQKRNRARDVYNEKWDKKDQHQNDARIIILNQAQSEFVKSMFTYTISAIDVQVSFAELNFSVGNFEYYKTEKAYPLFDKQTGLPSTRLVD